MVACCVICRIATTPRIEGQPTHCCYICEKVSGFRNAMRWKWERIKGAGLDWALFCTSACWLGSILYVKMLAVSCTSTCWQYLVRQHVGALGTRYKGEKVSVTGKESSEYAHHGSRANDIQSGPPSEQRPPGLRQPATQQKITRRPPQDVDDRLLHHLPHLHPATHKLPQRARREGLRGTQGHPESPTSNANTSGSPASARTAPGPASASTSE